MSYWVICQYLLAEFSLTYVGQLRVSTPEQTLTTNFLLNDANWHTVTWELSPLTVYINETRALQFTQEEVKWYLSDTTSIFIGAKGSDTGI